jgi:hypothetical protein
VEELLLTPRWLWQVLLFFEQGGCAAMGLNRGRRSLQREMSDDDYAEGFIGPTRDTQGFSSSGRKWMGSKRLRATRIESVSADRARGATHTAEASGSAAPEVSRTPPGKKCSFVVAARICTSMGSA